MLRYPNLNSNAGKSHSAPATPNILAERCKLGRRQAPLVAFTLGDRLRPIPIEAMNCIHRLKLTGAAILVFRASTSLQAAPAA
jgi:hypothetical protein